MLYCMWFDSFRMRYEEITIRAKAQFGGIGHSTQPGAYCMEHVVATKRYDEQELILTLTLDRHRLKEGAFS